MPGAGRNGRIVWYTNPFDNAAGARLAIRIHRNLAAFTAGFAQRVEAYAKANASWEDRTGDARAGLTAEGRQRLVAYYIDLYHTVDYGIWLEVRWSGKYAIIIPTLEVMGPQYMEYLAGIGMEGLAR
jgi:hypothetical protein